MGTLRQCLPQGKLSILSDENGVKLNRTRVEVEPPKTEVQPLHSLKLFLLHKIQQSARQKNVPLSLSQAMFR